MLRLIEPLDHPNQCNSFLLPEDDGDTKARYRRAEIGISEEPGKYYSTAEMLKKYQAFPEVIDYIADML